MAVMSIRRLAMHNVPRLRATATDVGLNAITGRGERAQTFEPGAVRYIKLGENGKWAATAIEHGIIPFGYLLRRIRGEGDPHLGSRCAKLACA